MLIDLWSIIAFILFLIASYVVGTLLFKYSFKILFGYWPDQKPTLTPQEKKERAKREENDAKFREDYMALQDSLHDRRR